MITQPRISTESAGRGIRGAGEDCLSPQGEFRSLQSGYPVRRGPEASAP